MPANGTTGRKTPAAAPSANHLDKRLHLDKLFDDWSSGGDTHMSGEWKKHLPTVKSAGRWDSEVTNVMKSRDPNIRSGPALNKVPSHLAKGFTTGHPMTDKPDILKCTHCKRAVSKHSTLKHIEGCLNKKQEKQRKKKEAKDARDAAARKEKAGDSDEEEDEDAKTTAGKTGLGASKKRKAIDEGDDAANGNKKKKTKKEEAKAKAPRPKAPVDVEKQCGVALDNGGQCARSLTCKSHSMGAKRAVPGRSAPYDKLLLEYQRKNQAKLQKAAFDANAPNPDDDDSLPAGPVDSEEERDAVMTAIARAWGGAPIHRTVFVPLRKRYEFNRMKGMMQSAFANRSSDGGSGIGAGGGGGVTGFFGAMAAPSIDSDGNVAARSGSLGSAARAMMAPGRKASVVAVS